MTAQYTEFPVNHNERWGILSFALLLASHNPPVELPTQALALAALLGQPVENMEDVVSHYEYGDFNYMRDEFDTMTELDKSLFLLICATVVKELGL